MIEGQVPRHHREDHDTDREVEEEDELPADRVGDESADRGPDQDRQPEDRAEEALVPAALGRCEEVGDDRQRDREERPGAEALDAAGADQLPHLLRQSGQERADHEHADPE